MASDRQVIFPVLRYADVHAAIDWLQRVLGFTVHVVYEGEGGAVEHAQLAFGRDLIMVGEAGGEEAGGEEADGPAWLYLACDDIDARYERAVAAGAEVVHAPADQDYGSREFTVADPGGHRWTLGTYRPDEDG